MSRGCVPCDRGEHVVNEGGDYWCVCCHKPVVYFTVEERYNAGLEEES